MQKCVIHPQYQYGASPTLHDVALLFLDKESTEPLGVLASTVPPPGSVLTFVGWGTTATEPTTVQDNLQ